MRGERERNSGRERERWRVRARKKLIERYRGMGENLVVKQESHRDASVDLRSGKTGLLVFLGANKVEIKRNLRLYCTLQGHKTGPPHVDQRPVRAAQKYHGYHFYGLEPRQKKRKN